MQKPSCASSTKKGGLPNITAGWQVFNLAASARPAVMHDVYGAITQDSYTEAGGNAINTTNSYHGSYLYTFNASRSSSVYGNGTTVRPAAVYTNWCIKF